MRLVINGEEVAVDAHPAEVLLDVLREQLGLTGTKEVCGRGECGACMVLHDGVRVVSCLLRVGMVRGPVATIEGQEEESEPLRRALCRPWGIPVRLLHARTDRSPGEALLREGAPA